MIVIIIIIIGTIIIIIGIIQKGLSAGAHYTRYQFERDDQATTGDILFRTYTIL